MLTKEAGFTVWLRPSGRDPWRPVCSAPTDAECFRLLQDHARQYRFVDLLTGPAGEDPNALPRRRWPGKGERQAMIFD
jgi:hypothetical protein